MAGKFVVHPKPKNDKTLRLTFDVDAGLRKRMDKARRDSRCSMSHFIREAIKYALDNTA